MFIFTRRFLFLFLLQSSILLAQEGKDHIEPITLGTYTAFLNAYNKENSSCYDPAMNQEGKDSILCRGTYGNYFYFLTGNADALLPLLNFSSAISLTK